VTLLWILCATIVGGALSVLAAGLLSFTALYKLVPRMVSYAVGAMLGAAFLHLLPEAFMQAETIEGLFATVLAGLLAFFLLEKAALWRHRHEHGEAAHDETHPRPLHVHKRPVATLIIVGDGFHNFVDGVLIASAFIADPVLGVTAAVALVAHEVPQEIGDFIVLLDCGLTRAKALMLNLASSAMAVVGGVIGYFALEGAQHLMPYVIALAAASFIYIAVADLIPGLHRVMDTRSTVWQIALIAAGIVTVALPYALVH
jgi:zinc and cadmium transporter